MKKKTLVVAVIVASLVGTGLIVWQATKKPPGAKITPTPTMTATVPWTPTVTLPPTVTTMPPITETPGGITAPYPSAPLCSAHDNSQFHTLWSSAMGCHYDHEHGETPFTPDVALAFPGFDLPALLGGVGIGHTNPSSPIENIAKHGGFKWQVDVPAPQGCKVGFEGGTVAVDAAAIQYHNFGDYPVELEGRVHSIAALLRQCKPGDTADKGYIYGVQHVDYGQVVSPYQGDVMLYPTRPMPGYASGLGPYISVDCIGLKVPPQVGQCRASRADILAGNTNTNSIWTSKSAFRVAPSGSPLLAILFRVRDTYQVFDWNDLAHPFTFIWICSADGGATYTATAGCRYNNSTSTVHEVQGVIPAEWDNLPGFDSEPQVGRITAEGYVTRFGQLNLACAVPGIDCHPIKIVRAFVGFYSTELSVTKVSNPTPLNTPERDFFFLNGQVVSETTSGAQSSGWIGQNN